MNQCYKWPIGVGRATPGVYNKGVNKGDNPVNIYQAEIDYQDGTHDVVYTSRPMTKTQRGRDRQMNNVTNYFCDQYRDREFRRIIVKRVPSV